MPEIPDIEAYRVALRPYVGQTLEELRLYHPFFLRTAEIAPQELSGKALQAVGRLAKRLVFYFEENKAALLHLMIAGRIKERASRKGSGAAPKGVLGEFAFADSSLVVTEAGTKRRAALYLLSHDAVALHDPGGIDPLTATYGEFAAAMQSGRHTLKRALTDQRKIAGIGNAYSDEILFRARMSPFTITTSLDDNGLQTLYDAVRGVLGEWVSRLCAEAEKSFPHKVTAFRPEMAVHGRFGKPCPVCGTDIQRIRYSENEANYCPRCQTEGRVLADRALSRLLKDDWPRRIEELEQLNIPNRVRKS